MASRGWPAKNLQNLEQIGRLRADPADAGDVSRHHQRCHPVHYGIRRCARARGHRRLVFEVLPHSCGAQNADALALVRAHDKRNKLEYEAIAEITEREVADLVGIAARLRDDVQAWLKRHRPELVRKK